jgi:SpoVK/Ycf46/Vps4 family AAA+-type ATPase
LKVVSHDAAPLVSVTSTKSVAELADAAEAPERLPEQGAPPLQVTQAHFDEALLRVTPSVSAADRDRYERLRSRLES